MSASNRVRQRRLIQKLHDQQRGLCWICGFPMILARKSTSRFQATIDHLVKKNLVPNGPERPARAAHALCNHQRKHYPLDHDKVREHVHFMRLWIIRNPPKELRNALGSKPIVSRIPTVR